MQRTGGSSSTTTSSSSDALLKEAVRVLYATYDSQLHNDLVAVFRACAETASHEQRQEAKKKAEVQQQQAKKRDEEQRQQAKKHAEERRQQTKKHAEEQRQRARLEMEVAAADAKKRAQELAAAQAAEQVKAAEQAAAQLKAEFEAARAKLEAPRVDREAARTDKEAQYAEVNASMPFVTKKAMKKARVEAEKEAAAKEEEYKLQRKEAKKERRQAEAAAKAHAEDAEKADAIARQVAARKAAIEERATTRIQRAVRGLLARRQRAKLQRRATLGKRFEAMKNWRHLLSFVFREQGFSLLLCASHAAAVKTPTAQAELPKSRPGSLKTALKDGNWTHIRGSKHDVYKRMVMTSDGVEKPQYTTLAKTPSDYRSNMNQLAKMRGKLEDGVERSYSIGCDNALCRATLSKDQQPQHQLLNSAVVLNSAGAEPRDCAPSPGDLILQIPLLAFQHSMADCCPSFMQRRRALDRLKAERASLMAIEAKSAISAALTPEEEKRYKELIRCRLDEKCKWLSTEMTQMIDREELTADELQIVEKEFEEKLLGPGLDPKAADALRGKLNSVRQAKPFVWKVKFAKEIASLERRLAALAELECPKSPLPLTEFVKLSERPELRRKLAAMKAESRGWFADG